MSGAAQARPLALAAVALIALLAALATEHRIDPPVSRPSVIVPRGGAWQEAYAAPLAEGALPGGCGLRLPPRALAVSHPVLPCGIRVVLDVNGVTASVQVAGRAAAPGGAAFGLTPELAQVLRVGEARPLRWALAAG